MFYYGSKVRSVYGQTYMEYVNVQISVRDLSEKVKEDFSVYDYDFKEKSILS
jgi:hypothetical protein